MYEQNTSITPLKFINYFAVFSNYTAGIRTVYFTTQQIDIFTIYKMVKNSFNFIIFMFLKIISITFYKAIKITIYIIAPIIKHPCTGI